MGEMPLTGPGRKLSEYKGEIRRDENGNPITEIDLSPDDLAYAQRLESRESNYTDANANANGDTIKGNSTVLAETSAVDKAEQLHMVEQSVLSTPELKFMYMMAQEVARLRGGEQTDDARRMIADKEDRINELALAYQDKIDSKIAMDESLAGEDQRGSTRALLERNASEARDDALAQINFILDSTVNTTGTGGVNSRSIENVQVSMPVDSSIADGALNIQRKGESDSTKDTPPGGTEPEAGKTEPAVESEPKVRTLDDVKAELAAAQGESSKLTGEEREKAVELNERIDNLTKEVGELGASGAEPKGDEIISAEDEAELNRIIAEGKKNEVQAQARIDAMSRLQAKLQQERAGLDPNSARAKELDSQIAGLDNAINLAIAAKGSPVGKEGEIIFVVDEKTHQLVDDMVSASLDWEQSRPHEISLF